MSCLQVKGNNKRRQRYNHQIHQHQRHCHHILLIALTFIFALSSSSLFHVNAFQSTSISSKQSKSIPTFRISVMTKLTTSSSSSILIGRANDTRSPTHAPKNRNNLSRSPTSTSTSTSTLINHHRKKTVTSPPPPSSTTAAATTGASGSSSPLPYQHHISSTNLKMRSNANHGSHPRSPQQHYNLGGSSSPVFGRTSTHSNAHTNGAAGRTRANTITGAISTSAISSTSTTSSLSAFLTGNRNRSGSTSPSHRHSPSRRRRAAKAVLSAFSRNKKINSISNSKLFSSPSNDEMMEESSTSAPSTPAASSLTTATATATAAATATAKEDEMQMSLLKQENDILKRTIDQLTHENDILKNNLDNNKKNPNDLIANPNQQIVIEQFEGEGLPMMNAFGDIINSKSWWDNDNNDSENPQTQNNNRDNNDSEEEEITMMQPLTSSAISTPVTTDGCDEYEDGVCPIEPHLTFKDALRDRAYWLVGLLTLQSMSGFILQRNESLLQTHPIIIYFLTMLVGAGGNAGNQAAVRVIRGIALGTLTDKTQKQFLNREFKMALALSAVLSVAGFIRAVVFRTPIPETIAITSALSLIVFTSICFGAVLPILLKKINVDPAHSSTSIQVIMDILGVVLTVIVSTAILDSPFGTMVMEKLSLVP